MKKLVFSFSMLVLVVLGFSGCKNNDPEEIVLKSITVTPDEVLLTVGNSQQITVTLSPENATNVTLLWNAVNESVATVDDGLITAVGIGSTTVIVRSQTSAGYITAEVQVNVGGALSEIHLSSPKPIIEIGEQITLGVTTVPASAIDYDPVWSIKTGDEFIDLTQEGVVTGKAAGTATVKVTSGNISG